MILEIVSPEATLFKGEVTSPENNNASGDTISKIIFFELEVGSWKLEVKNEKVF